MNIRQAIMADLDALAAVEAVCFPPAEAATREQIEDRLAHFADRFWVGLENGRIISFVDGFATDEKDLRDEMYADASLHDPKGKWQMIFGVNTIPEYRKQGKAGELIRRFISESYRAGCLGMVLTCKEEKIPFYAAFGFEDEGISGSTHGNVVWHQMRKTFRRTTGNLVVQAEMTLQAGAALFHNWTSGETVHAGIGWFEPFGQASYIVSRPDAEEAKAFPIGKYLTKDGRDLLNYYSFEIFRMADGDLYAWGGVFGKRGQTDSELTMEAEEDDRRDVLTSLFVGGTGRYAGASGLMTGTAQGAGPMTDVTDKIRLPQSITRHMTGFIRLPE